MKEISIEPILDKIFKKQNTCNMRELNKAVSIYQKAHPDTYVEADRDSIHSLIEMNRDKYYWDSKTQLIRKEDVIHCPCCRTDYRMYSDSKKYSEVLAYIIET